MSKETVGQLVYIPSDTSLLQYERSSPSKVLQTRVPTNLIVLREKETELGVWFEGEVWYVDKKKVYNV